MTDPLYNPQTGHGVECLCNECMRGMHPVDALKRLGVEMTPEREAAARSICDERVYEAMPSGGEIRHPDGRDFTPRVIKRVISDDVSTKDGMG